MMISAHATRTEAGTFHVRLVLSPTDERADPPPSDVLEAVTNAVWSLGYVSHTDSHTIEVTQVPRQSVTSVAKEMIRVTVSTLALWRETELYLPNAINLPFSTTM